MKTWCRKNTWWLTILVVVLGVTVIVATRRPTSAAGPEETIETPKIVTASSVRVSVTHPTAGGLPRRTSLPCSAHWHESAELFAKISGYLDSQEVDIGSHVTRGQTLATVDVPELERDIDLAAAVRQQALAEVGQIAARKKTAAAEQRASEAACVRAEADVQRWDAEHAFREKEYQRFRELNKAESVQSAIVEEKLYQFKSVVAGRRAAVSAIQTAKEEALAAAARVELSEADYVLAEAKASVADAHLAKAKLMASFGKIVSPYDGVVTSRNFHRGAFVRAAEKGGDVPLLKVARTDLIRVVVQIPDREVPFAHPGDAVRIEFDALPGREFIGELARISHSEDVATRTMRAEVDLPNDKGLIVNQMYGRMQIDLEAASTGLTIPSACLVGDVREGRGKVFVVRENVAKLQSVSVGPDTGIQIEILEGLAPTDEVVVQPAAGLSDGTPVTPDKNGKSSH